MKKVFFQMFLLLIFGLFFSGCLSSTAMSMRKLNTFEFGQPIVVGDSDITFFDVNYYQCYYSKYFDFCINALPDHQLVTIAFECVKKRKIEYFWQVGRMAARNAVLIDKDGVEYNRVMRYGTSLSEFFNKMHFLVPRDVYPLKIEISVGDGVLKYVVLPKKELMFNQLSKTDDGSEQIDLKDLPENWLTDWNGTDLVAGSGIGYLK